MAAAEVACIRYARHPRRMEPDFARTGLRDDITWEELIAGFRRGTGRTFFFDPHDVVPIVQELRRSDPEWAVATLATADRIVAGERRILGAIVTVPECNLGGDTASMVWHRDALSGYTWDPGTFYRKIEVPYDRADIKFPWELSRGHHLPTLAIAYRLIGDRSYATAMQAEISAWMDANPCGYGVNWFGTMDVAIRAVNWLWAYRMLPLDAIDDAFLHRLVAALYCHGCHIAANIETYAGGITTNHTLADYVGLLSIGLQLPEMAEAGQWVRTATEGVERCMEEQVLADGGQFENSVSYHRLTLEMFSAAWLLANRAGRPLSTGYRSRLESMFEFVLHYIRPDGLAPLVGDNDDGRLQILSDYFEWVPQDHRYLLALGAALFPSRPVTEQLLKAPGTAAATCWLTGRQHWSDLKTRASGAAVAVASRGFVESGRYVMRNDRHYAFVSADEVGSGGLGSHKHNDILSFELAVDGVPLVVDPGVYAYTSDLAWRAASRATSSHSTITIDGQEQNRPGGSFVMASDAQVRVNDWTVGNDVDVLDAEHSGYARLSSPATHRRIFVFSKCDGTLLVIDAIAGSGVHRVDSYLQLACGGTVDEWRPDNRATLQQTVTALAARSAAATLGPLRVAGDGLVYATAHLTVAIVPLNWNATSVLEGWSAPGYGRRLGAPRVRMSTDACVPLVAGYLITPRTGRA
jgi:hypothetical protein